MKEEDRQKVLKDYTTPGNPLAFTSRGGIAKRISKNSNKANREILSYNYSYPLHRVYKRPKYFNPVFSYSPREQVQCDLLDIKRLKEENNGVQYLFVCIDIFSRFAWVRSMKNKTAEVSEEVLSNIFESMDPLLPKSIAFDKGTEFLNQKVKRLLADRKIKIINPTSPSKAVFAERFIRTFKSLIYRYLTEKQTNRYIDELQNLVNTYNLRPHRSLNFNSPSEAERDINIDKFRDIFMNNRRTTIEKGRQMKMQFQIGDIVRIYKVKRVFDKEYEERFSREYFQVVARDHSKPIPTYTVKSLNKGDIITGNFYANELQLVQGDIWKIEKIIKERKVRKKKQFFVKWLDFDDQHNSWIGEDDLV